MILVTGMHRSGTSLVAMTMEGLGFSFGEHSAFYEADQWNARGYFERRDVMDLNNRMITGFERTGSSLAAFAGQIRYLLEPSLDRVVARGVSFASEMRAIGDKPGVNAIKDPRFCLTWSAWAETIDIEACVVCIRHPFDVAGSLRRRQHIPTRLGIRFWRYHMSALRERTPERMLVLDLDSLIESPRAELEGLIEGLDVDMDVDEALRRFDNAYAPGMTKRNAADQRPELDGETQQLWDWLLAHRPTRIAESRE